MRVAVYGATGMVGQGVLRECLAESEVETVLTVGRSATGVKHQKLRELVLADLGDYRNVEAELTGLDACFFCLGVSSSGMPEQDYERITYGITLAAGEFLSRVNPRLTFVYVSGAGTDSTEQGRVRWARVKGRTENALLRLPFAGAYMFRPGIIQPLDGITSKTRVYQIFYDLSRPVLPLLRRLFPNQIVTTREMGKAMLRVAKKGWPARILESRDIRAAADLSGA